MGGGAEGEFGLAKTDGSAGVRESRENVIEMGWRWEDERWRKKGGGR